MVRILASSSLSLQHRRRRHIQRAGAQRAEHLVDVVLGAAGDDQDRARALFHDDAGRLHAVHFRHVQIHQDQVRTVFRAHAHRFGAGTGYP
jgi:hypothetical protein